MMEQFIKLLKDVQDAERLYIDPDNAGERAEKAILEFAAKHFKEDSP
jgi:hypothetical protein